MFSTTMTRFIASLAMTLVMWLTCSTGAVAADGTNPGPCLLPYECIKSPVLSGVISGPTVVCIGVPATWTLNESFTPGLKQRCEETAIAVTKTKTEWVWNYVGGPEPTLGYQLGTSFTSTFTQEGTYTIHWDGIATLSDSVCDYVSSKVEMTFTVVKPTPKAVLTSIVTKPDSICLDEESDGICTIGDQSLCDAGPYTVKWKVESDGGPQNLQFTPASGQVVLTFMQSVDLKFKIKAGPGAKGGTAKIKLTATVNGVDQTSSGKIDVIELKSVTHNAPEYQPWTPGATVKATAVVEGGLGNKEILYEAINVHTGAVGGSLSVASTSATVPINEPGRYRLQATLCNKSVISNRIFVLWTATLSPKKQKVQWDPIEKIPNPDEYKAMVKIAEDLAKIISQLGEKVTDLDEVSGPKLAKKTEELANYIITSPRKVTDLLDEYNIKKATADNKLDSLLFEQSGIVRDIENAERNIRLSTPAYNAAIINVNYWNAKLAEVIAGPNTPELINEAQRYIAEYQADVDREGAIIRNATEDLARLRPRLEANKESLKAIKATLVELVKKINALIEVLPVVRAIAQQAHDVATSAIKLGERARGLVDIGRGLAGRFVQVGLGAFNTYNDYNEVMNANREYDEAFTKAHEQANKSKEYVEAYEKAFKDWNDTPQKRLPSPQVVNLTLTTKPGGLNNITISEFGSYRTKDPTIPNAEGDPYYGGGDTIPHLSFIGGNKECWNGTIVYSTAYGEVGSLPLDFYVFGNLGTSSLTAKINNVSKGQSMKAGIISEGSTEEELKEKIAELAFKEKERMDLLKAKVKALLAIVAGLSLIITVVSVGFWIAATYTMAGALLSAVISPFLVVAGLVVTAVAVIGALAYLIWDIFGGGTVLEESVLKLFPSTEYN
jgi:hypothetical protein